ncbi:MAG: hypothetical protein GC178_00485 [Flavobacteriales bacterium]|nr:hypothetical protein [Flavobacteriales bacterium]
MSQRTDNKWRHYRAKLTKAELQIELLDLEEFLRFAEDHVVTSIYCFEQHGTITAFGISHKGGLLTVDAQGYHQLTDYRTAREKGFGDAATYYDATEKGFETWEAYQLSVGSELSDPETYKALVDEHYEDGYPDYVKMVEEGRLKVELPAMANPYDLYRYGKDAGFTNWFELQVALEKGFTLAADYRTATEQGYTTAADFEAGRQGGFINAKEWQEAKEAECFSRSEFRSKLNLDLMDAPDLKHDARVLLQLLSRLPEKKEVTVDQIQRRLEKDIELYQDPASKMLRNWFTLQLRDRKALLQFLRTNADIKKFGTYHHDREVFATRAVQERQVVLDGSNVAHNSHGNHRSVPKVENLQRMMDDLKRRGFKDIMVIVDASLRHRIDDPVALDAFADSVDYFEVPSGTSADVFVIAHVKRNNCLMVSNDLFWEWKAMDPWIEDNIDFYRLSFRITDKKVILPEFDG